MEGYTSWFTSLRDRPQYVAIRGQGMVEYGLILALVAVAVIGILGLLGASIGGAFEIAIETLTGGTTE